MSAAAVWKNAPSAIRQAPTQTLQRNDTPHQPPPPQSVNSRTRKDDTSNPKTPTRHGNPNITPVPISQGLSPLRPTGQRHSNNLFARQIDDTTTATFNSTASTTLTSSIHATRYPELDTSIQANQQALKTLTKNHETMEDKLLNTMTTCHENTQHLVAMQGQLNNLQTTMHTIAHQMSLITQHFNSTPDGGTHENAQIQLSPAKKKLRQAHTNEDTFSETTASPLSVTPMSRTPPNAHFPTNHSITPAAQEEAQYNAPCSPGSAMQE